jgi:hypothetical protein
MVLIFISLLILCAIVVYVKRDDYCPILIIAMYIVGCVTLFIGESQLSQLAGWVAPLTFALGFLGFISSIYWTISTNIQSRLFLDFTFVVWAFSGASFLIGFINIIF